MAKFDYLLHLRMGWRDKERIFINNSGQFYILQVFVHICLTTLKPLIHLKNISYIQMVKSKHLK